MSKSDYAVLQSQVMGRTPVLWLSFLLGLAGFGQLFKFPASKVLYDQGGESLNLVWAVVLIVAMVLCWAARLRANYNPYEGIVLEVGGIILIILGLGVYGWALFQTPPGGLAGRLVVFALVTGSVGNLAGRAVLLVRRIIVVSRANTV